jgi:hypothetical protein
MGPLQAPALDEHALTRTTAQIRDLFTILVCVSHRAEVQPCRPLTVPLSALACSSGCAAEQQEGQDHLAHRLRSAIPVLSHGIASSVEWHDSGAACSGHGYRVCRGGLHLASMEDKRSWPHLSGTCCRSGDTQTHGHHRKRSCTLRRSQGYMGNIIGQPRFMHGDGKRRRAQGVPGGTVPGQPGARHPAQWHKPHHQHSATRSRGLLVS